jgi:CRISPR-associated endoribonuclease Cas6
MRLRIELALEGKTINMNYRSKIQGVIYSMLKHNRRTSSLHDHGHRAKNRPYKLFVFSDLIGEFDLDLVRKTMGFKTNAYFEVSSWDEQVMLTIVNHLQNHKDVLFGSTVIEIVAFQVFQESRLRNKSHIEFITISPVTVYKTEGRKTVYLSPSEPDFFHGVHENIENKFKAIGVTSQIEEPSYKVIDFTKRSVYFRDVFSIAYNIHFVLEPISENYVRMMLTTGIGSKNSMGFGMLRYEN